MTQRPQLTFVALAAFAVFGCSTMPSQSRAASTQSATAALDEFRAAFQGDWAVDFTDDGFVASITGVPARRSFIDDDGRKLLPFLPRLAGAPAHSSFGDAPRVVHVGSLTQYRYPQRIGDREVENADYIVQVDENGGPYEIFLNAVHNTTVAEVARSPADAVALVRTLADQELAQQKAFSDAGENARVLITLLDAGPHYLAADRQLYNVYEVEARASTSTTDAHETLVMLRIYSVDASSTANDKTAIVRLRNMIHFSTTGKARVFKANPVTLLSASGTISSFCPAPKFSFVDPPYSDEQLMDLDDPTNGEYALTGPAVCIKYDRKPPDGPMKRPDSDFSDERGTVDFAAANVYYHITELARRATSLGFASLVRSRLEVEPFDYIADGVDACFIEGNGSTVKPHMNFCRTRVCGIYAAEDADVVAHEYAHSLLQSKTESQFLLDLQKKDKNEAAAINEGFADYWSLSYGAKESGDHKYDVDSFAEWANGGHYLRNYPYRKHGTFRDTNGFHENGQIWSGTLYEILRTIFGMSTDAADKLILRGHLQRASKNTAPTMKEMAEGIVVADGGANRKGLCAIFKTQELWPLLCCKANACIANHLLIPN